MKEKYKVIFIFFIVIISRLPFIWNSPGIDPDNWLVLFTGQEIAETGVYKASRLPGYPVSEYMCAFFGTNSWWILNIITVFCSALAMIYFYRIMTFFHLKDIFFTTIALAFTPGIFIASTINMEYMWSIFFLLAGIFYLLKRKYVLSGFLLGFMISTRFTNIVLLLPILYLIIFINKEKKIVKILSFLITTIVTFCICFLPVFKQYGTNLFPSEIWELPSIKVIISYYTLFLYGFLGLISLMISLLFILKNPYAVKKVINDKKPLVIFCLLMIVVTSAVYFRFPFESYYNLPLVPFLIIILNIILFSEKVRTIVFLLLITSPFIFNLSMSKMKLKGSIFVNDKIENDFLNYTQELHRNFNQKNNNHKILIAGGFYYTYNYLYPHSNKKVLLRPSEEELKHLISKGYKIYYPSGIKDELKDLKKYDITKYGESIIPPLIYDR